MREKCTDENVNDSMLTGAVAAREMAWTGAGTRHGRAVDIPPPSFYWFHNLINPAK